MDLKNRLMLHLSGTPSTTSVTFSLGMFRTAKEEDEGNSEE
jgi:hypothetical protein